MFGRSDLENALLVFDVNALHIDSLRKSNRAKNGGRFKVAKVNRSTVGVVILTVMASDEHLFGTCHNTHVLEIETHDCQTHMKHSIFLGQVRRWYAYDLRLRREPIIHFASGMPTLLRELEGALPDPVLNFLSLHRNTIVILKDNQFRSRLRCSFHRISLSIMRSETE